MSSAIVGTLTLVALAIVLLVGIPLVDDIAREVVSAQ